MVKEEREKIKKSEAAQMNTHCIWFCSTYGDSANYLPVMIISTRELAYDADLNSNIVIMRKGKLRQFKDAVRGYLKEFKDYDLNDIPDSAVQSAINAHGLSVDSLLKDYYESPKR